MSAAYSTELPSALDWYATMPDPALAARDGGTGHLSLRRYVATPPEMTQPALADNLICMHLGGAKEVRRWHEGRHDVHTVDLNALTIMPAQQSNRWQTRGPIDFAHITLSQALIGQIAEEEFGRDSAAIQLRDDVGFRDPYLESLFAALLNAVEAGDSRSRLYPDSILIVLIVTLLDRRSTLARTPSDQPLARPRSKGGLAPWKLRRVVEYMNEHLAGDISLADLAALAGLSRAQFFRAFRQSTDSTPHRYLTDLRLEAARSLIESGTHDPAAIAPAVGLPSPERFAALFRQRFGINPRLYRNAVK